jgi:hypothetical protein
MARSTRSHKQAGYISARPNPSSPKPLATHGRSIHMGHVWTAPFWQELFGDDARLVGAAMCPAFRRGAYPWPLAIMLSARSGPGQKPAVKSCPGTSGVSRSPDRPAGCIILPLPFPTSLARLGAHLSSCLRNRLSIGCAADHQRPGNAGDLVGQGDGGNLDWPARHQFGEPGPPRIADLLGASDHR